MAFVGGDTIKIVMLSEVNNKILDQDSQCDILQHVTRAQMKSCMNKYRKTNKTKQWRK